jgi:peptidoglycan/xylan/chitin deacetylase (PgdA/CDA1 family)
MNERDKNEFKRITKLGISLGFFVVRCFWDIIYRQVGGRVPGSCVILYYHAVPYEQRAQFASQMDMLLRCARPVGINVNFPLASGTHHAAVTFDDGLQSVVENALPQLEKRRIPSTLFICPGALGQHPNWWASPLDPERHETVVSSDQLRELPSDLVTIGSHTLTHPILPSLSEAEARRELCASRAELEELLKRRITLLSFPFGALNRDVVQWCREAGYERVFSSLPVIAFRDPGEFVTGRVAADPTDWPLEFYLKLLGAYRWLPYALSFKRWVLSNALVSKIRCLRMCIVR